jgi:hypothetical protein
MAVACGKVIARGRMPTGLSAPHLVYTRCGIIGGFAGRSDRRKTARLACVAR